MIQNERTKAVTMSGAELINGEWKERISERVRFKGFGNHVFRTFCLALTPTLEAVCRETECFGVSFSPLSAGMSVSESSKMAMLEVEQTVYRPDGRKSYSFRCRLRRSAEDRERAFFDEDFVRKLYDTICRRNKMTRAECVAVK